MVYLSSQSEGLTTINRVKENIKKIVSLFKEEYMGGYDNINNQRHISSVVRVSHNDFKGSYCEGHWFKSSMCFNY